MSFFTFQADLPHQADAISSVARLLDGLERETAPSGFIRDDEIVSNVDLWDVLDDAWLMSNLNRIQESQNQEHPEADVPITHQFHPDDGPMVEDVSLDSHRCPHFTIEMETGTGKTYVYLRTMLELHAAYGLTKFVLVVPSVAILEGVKKTFRDTREHFNSLRYGVTNFSLVVYDGDHLPRLRTFAQSRYPTLLLMTQQSFIHSKNNIYKLSEKLPGERRPFEWIQATRPVVVLDEPQKMGSEKARAAVRTLRPLLALRYSATHRADERPNPLYRLTPLQAFRYGLVKQVEVVGIADLDLSESGNLQLREVERDPMRARVRALCMGKEGTTSAMDIVLRQNESVFDRTKLPEHRGLVVRNMSVGDPSTLTLAGGAEGERTLTTNDSTTLPREHIWAAQIEHTVAKHFERQRQLRPLGIKVLSLFFLDRVANYQGENARVRELFDAIFDRLKTSEPEFAQLAARDVREAYFAKAKAKGKGATEEEIAIDAKAESDEARRAFEVIMRSKDALVKFPGGGEKARTVAFIFAHSALREGWDNPNVFQICTLNQAVSDMRKRQEIGRGLRLCVNQTGRRVEVPGVNVLTVVASESYETYVSKLQTEFEEDGEEHSQKPARASRAHPKRQNALFNKEEFRQFWQRLCQRLDYTIDLDEDGLVAQCVSGLDAAKFPVPTLTVSQGRFIVDEYSLRVIKPMGLGGAQVRVTTRSSVPNPAQPSLLPAPEDRILSLFPSDDLLKKLGNPHFKGFKVQAVDHHLGELRVVFENACEITPTNAHHFSVTRIDKLGTTQTTVALGHYPVPDFIGRAAAVSHLTRRTVWRIFDAMSDGKKQTLRHHPEGWTNEFVRVVAEAVRDHIVANLRFHDNGRSDADMQVIETAFPLIDDQVQRDLVDGGKASLYDKVQVDSGVERDFIANRLRPDEDNIAVWFKFPPGFKIKLPKVIGDYNPDWGILRSGGEQGLTLELVRETKGTDDLDKLRFQNEGRKLLLAQRYFGALGIDYRFFAPEVECYWESMVDAGRRERAQQGLPKGTRKGTGVPVYDLKIAAGAFSSGQAPDCLGQVWLPERLARRPGLFVAQVYGESMNKVAPDRAWCLWQHLGAGGTPAAAVGELLVVRAADPYDSSLGGFTFKRLTAAGDQFVLQPKSTNASYAAIPLGPAGEGYEFIARFIEVIDVDEGDIES